MKRSWSKPLPGWQPLRRLLELRRPPRDPECEADHLIAAGVWDDDRREDLVRVTASRERRRQQIGPSEVKKLLDGGSKSGRIAVFARCPSSAPFRQLPPDVVTSLKIIDWENGVGASPDGTAFSSIHFGTHNQQDKAPRRQMRTASSAAIFKEITALYDEIEARSGKSEIPNINDTAPQVQLRLMQQGVTASKRQIKEVACHSALAARRRAIGPTKANERRLKKI